MRVVIYKQQDHKDLEALINNTKLSSDETIVDVDIQPIVEYVYETSDFRIGNSFTEFKKTSFLAIVYIEEEGI